MKMHFVDRRSEGDVEEQIAALRHHFKLTTPQLADFLYCGSIYSYRMTKLLKEETGLPVVAYCWDYYSWAHAGNHHDTNNWALYAEFLRDATVIVPSEAQKRLLKELIGVDAHVVRSGVKKRPGPVIDGNFILDPVRYYPEKNRTWAEEAAAELNIPLIHSEHQFTNEEFQELVASCTFMTCAYREASTGGLTLAEGLWLGKPALVSNSPYMGAKDYLGPHGFYFQYDDFEDLKVKMDLLWLERPQVDAKDYFNTELSFDRMAWEIHNVCANSLK